MAALTLIVPIGYGLVLLEALALGLHCVHEGFAGYAVRKRVFSKQFFQTNFPDIKPTPEDGYPDIGHGRYSDKLSDRDWQDLNNAQRAHYNYLEQLPTVITTLCIAGLTYPRVTVVLGAGMLVGRFLYARGYRNAGSRGRLPGVLLIDACLAGLLIAGGLSGWSIGGGWQGMQNALAAFTKF